MITGYFLLNNYFNKWSRRILNYKINIVAHCKFNFINLRFPYGITWSETGKTYVPEFSRPP